MQKLANKLKPKYNLSDVNIIVYQHKGNNLNTTNTEIWGYLRKNIYKNKEYIVFFTEDLPEEQQKNFLLHELAHICQYEEGLLTLENGRELWKGVDVMNYKNYWNRPHERNARKRVRKFKFKNRKWLRKL